MDKFAENIYRLCEEAQPYTYVLAIVSFLVIGAMFLIPSLALYTAGNGLQERSYFN